MPVTVIPSESGWGPDQSKPRSPVRHRLFAQPEHDEYKNLWKSDTPIYPDVPQEDISQYNASINESWDSTITYTTNSSATESLTPIVQSYVDHLSPDAKLMTSTDPDNPIDRTCAHIHVPGNNYDIRYYVQHQIRALAKPNHYLLPAPCGTGKTMLAPGMLLQIFEKKRLIIISERISSTTNAFNSYCSRKLEGITGIGYRAGGKTLFSDPTITSMDDPRINTMMFTCGAFVDSYLHLATEDTLIMLDECHNVTTAWIRTYSLKRPTVIFTSATSPFDYNNTKADLTTPFKSDIYITNAEQSHDPFAEVRSAMQLIPDLGDHSSLVIVHTVDQLDAVSKYLSTHFEMKVKSVCRERPFSIKDVIEFSKTPGIIVATDILQESVTLHCKYFFDTGYRIRPRMNLYQLVSEYDGTSKLDKSYLDCYYHVRCPLSISSIAQLCGRAGRVRDDCKVFIFVRDEPSRTLDYSIEYDKRTSELYTHLRVSRLTNQQIQKFKKALNYWEQKYISNNQSPPNCYKQLRDMLKFGAPETYDQRKVESWLLTCLDAPSREFVHYMRFNTKFESVECLDQTSTDRNHIALDEFSFQHKISAPAISKNDCKNTPSPTPLSSIKSSNESSIPAIDQSSSAS